MIGVVGRTKSIKFEGMKRCVGPIRLELHAGFNSVNSVVILSERELRLGQEEMRQRLSRRQDGSLTEALGGAAVFEVGEGRASQTDETGGLGFRTVQGRRRFGRFLRGRRRGGLDGRRS